MARYRIVCRISPLGPGQHLVTVVAVPDAGETELAEITAETRVFISLELARAESVKMVGAMRARVVARGHEVSALETE